LSEDTRKETPTSKAENDTAEQAQEPKQSGPTFTESPDPLGGLRKATGDAWKSTAGRTVSMRVYIGSILAVVILMLLARCGG
jgi:hypothetical protein